MRIRKEPIIGSFFVIYKKQTKNLGLTKWKKVGILTMVSEKRRENLSNFTKISRYFVVTLTKRGYIDSEKEKFG